MKNSSPNYRRKPDHSGMPSRDSGGGDLPRWDLTEFYTAPDSPALAEDMETIDALIAEFVDQYQEKVARLSGAELGQAIAEYERIEAMRHNIYCYTFLLEAEDRANFPKTEKLRQWMTETGDHLSFFIGEIGDMKEQDLMTKIAAPDLAHYAPWVALQRAGQDYLLQNSVEAISRDYDDAGISALRRLYAQTMADIKVTWQGEPLTLAAAENIIGDPAVDVARRIELRKVMGEALQKNSQRVALVYNTLIKDHLIDAELRGFSRPEQGVNRANLVSDDIVDTMHKTGKSAYSRLSHKFFRWKAEQHHVDLVNRAQLTAPLPGDENMGNKIYSWDEGRKLVLRAFRRFSSKFGRLAQRMFDENHIDAGAREGKEGGGFCMPAGPSHLPYILLNHTGTADDVSSGLGHELGHAIHQALAERARGSLLSERPRTVDETASIFAEMLVFEEMLRGEKDERRRRQLLVDKVESMLSNSLRQLAYYEFERQVFAERKNGEMDAERISDIWVETQRAYFGPSVELDICDRYRWMTVPHFFDSPFYVYSYAFAQVMVSGLYQAYKQAESEGEEAREAFIQSYTELLETGITKNIHEMFKPFGLEPDTAEFWNKGLELIDRYIAELSGKESPALDVQDKFTGASRPQDRFGAKGRPPRRPPF